MAQTAGTVHVVDDDPAVRQSLGWLLESASLAVLTYASADDFLAVECTQRPACLLLDVRLPGLGGLELLERLSETGRGLPTVIITGHADVPMAVRAMKIGALDFIEKPFGDDLLLERVHAALQADQQDGHRQRAIAEARRRATELSDRERQVMGLVVKGLVNKQVAGVLGISPKTVEVHRGRVMHKMQAQSVAELTRMVMVAGLTDD